MSSTRWILFLRPVFLLGFMVLVLASGAYAQYSSSLADSNSTSLTSGEFQPGGSALLNWGGPSGPPAQPTPFGGGSGAGQSSEKHHFYSQSHIAAEAGGGFSAPVGNDRPYLTWGGNLSLGGGLHLSNRLSLLAEYQFIDDKLPGPFVAAGGGTSGNAHIWSLTLGPVIDLFPKATNSAYVTGGGGFYRKLTSFTVEVCCDFYGYEVSEVANHFSSNQGGFNFGFGLTHRIGGTYSDGSMKIYGEARYLWVDTPRFNAFTGPNIAMGTTGVVPVTFGLRW
jgi:hypothetical protein